MPKKYILFTDDEFEDMMNGREIEHPLEDGTVLYFMSDEHFKQQVRPSIPLCHRCRGVSHTYIPFKVTIHTGHVLDVVFNFCPECGRDLRS